MLQYIVKASFLAITILASACAIPQTAPLQKRLKDPGDPSNSNKLSKSSVSSVSSSSKSSKGLNSSSSSNSSSDSSNNSNSLAWGAIAPGHVRVWKNRLYFNAKIKNAPIEENEKEDETHPARARLIGPNGVVGEAPVSHTYMGDYHYCKGLDDDKPERGSLDCSIPVVGAAPGKYRLELLFRGKVLDQFPFELIKMRTTDDKAIIIINPQQIADTLFLDDDSLIYWHKMDVRDPVQSIEFIWLHKGEVYATGGNFAQGHPLWYTGTPLVDTVKVVGKGPGREVWMGNRKVAKMDEFEQDPQSFRLILFQEAKLIGVFRPGQAKKTITALVPATDLSKDALNLAQKEAMREYAKHSRMNVQYFGVSFRENVVCAVVTNPHARSKLNDMLSSGSAGIWAAHDADKAFQEADNNPMLTESQRKRLRKHGQNKLTGAVTSNQRAKAEKAEVMKMAAKFNEGCMNKLVNESDKLEVQAGQSSKL